LKDKDKKVEVVETVEEGNEITPYEAMDLVDESQIVNEIEGKVGGDEALVYSFPDKVTGKEVTGLSWKGTKAVWWAFNAKKVTQMTITDKVIITQGDNYVDVAAYAYDELRKIGAWGMARGYTKQQTRNGEMEDRFASAKAMSKAQRNALNQLFPMEKVAEMLKLFIKQGKVQALTPSVVSQVRQQVTGASANKQVTQQDLMKKFGMDLSQVPPVCPNCGATMNLVQRKDGSGIFWSCINWRTKGCKGYNVDEVDIDGTITMKKSQGKKPVAQVTKKPVDDIPF
jgi:hypothetical protein